MVIPEHINTCSFCDKSQDQVQHLIAGPGNHYICDECIDLRRKKLEDACAALTTNPDQHASSQPGTTTSNTLYSCSFCGKSYDQIQRLIAGPGSIFICGECIDLRRKKLEDEWVALNPNPDENTSSNTLYSCSFCDKSQEQVQRLIAGPGGFFICDECVGLRMKIIQEESEKGKR